LANKSGALRLIKELTGHNSGVYALGSDENHLFSGAGDGMLGAWDLETLEPSPFSVRVGKPVYSILAHNSHLLIGQSQGGIHVIDRNNKKEVKHLQFHRNGVFHLLYNQRFNQFYSLGGEGGLAVFDADNFRQIIYIQLSEKKLRKCILNETGSSLFVGGSDGYVHELETEYFNELGSYKCHEGGVYAMCLGENKQLVSGGRDAHIRIWNTQDGLTEVRAIPAHNYAIYEILPFNEGYISVSRDRIAKKWDSNFENPERLLGDRTTSHANSINTAHVKSGRVYTGSDDRTIRVWSV
jgi:WD40 repeat protein